MTLVLDSGGLSLLAETEPVWRSCDAGASGRRSYRRWC
jgi:hypothetical protein